MSSPAISRESRHTAASRRGSPLVPALGYVKGNIAVISMKANMIKNDGTAVDLERVLAWMKTVGAP